MAINRSMFDGFDRSTNGEGLLLELVAPTCRTFLDVGANVGDWTGHLLRFGSRVEHGILFEPAARTVGDLRRRFADFSTIEIVEAAVGAQPGFAPFYEDASAGETSSLFSSHVHTLSSTRTVPLTTLDLETERRDLADVDFLKIDTEGYDLEVLLGASRLFSEQRIGIVQFEYNSPWRFAGSTLARAYSFLQSHAYEVFLLKATGLHRLPYERVGEYFSYSNFVAVRPRSYDLIRPLTSDRR